MSEGPYRVVSGNYKDRPDHAMSYWKIEPDVGLPRLAMRHVVERQCDACNRAFAAGVEAERARVAGLAEACRAVVRNGRGRSGGSVYMVNRVEWLALKDALAATIIREAIERARP